LNAAGLEARCDSAARALGPLLGGQRIAWWARLSLDHLALDLAIQRCGAASQPKALGGGSKAAADGGGSWIRIACEEPAVGRRVWYPSTARSGTPPLAAEPFSAPVGSVAVELVGGGQELWSAAEHRQRAAGLGARLEGGQGESARRDIVVLHRPLCEPGPRLLSTWALASGAALLLEPEAEMWLSTAVWARPTVLAATLDEFAGAASWVESSDALTRRRRGPLGRLRRLLVLDGRSGELPEPWRRLGVGAEGAQ
jgi:hypothetical protein